ATAALGKDGEQTGFDNVLKKVAEKLNDEDWKKKATQKQVNALLKQLQDAQEKIAKEYKTDAKLLENEVGDKDAQGKDVIPPFEASVPYKNALEKAKTEDPATTDPESATVKLKAYADQLEAAQKLINQVNNPDPNAKPEERPSQDDVDKALAALKQAKKDIDDKFKTKVDKLQNEVDDKNEDGSARTPEFEKSTEFANLQGKTKDGKKPDDLVAYEQALAKAKELIDKNDGKVTKDGQEVDVPKDQLPTQAQVDAAKKALKEIKDKILANYKTSPVDLQKEVDLSKDGDDDKRDDVFENTPAFKNATAKGDEASKKALEEYNAKLKAAKEMLDKFDRATGQLKKDAKDVPTQAKLDEALKALQDAKKKITDDYATQKQNLRTDYGNSPDVSNYGWASDAAKDAYKKALEDANAKLGDTNATQAEVDAAQKALKDALEALVKSANANRRAYYEDMVIDARNALQKLVDANEATHLKDLYTHAEPAAQHEFMAAMDNAKKVLADKEALASELDAARVRLLRALDGLAAHQLPGMTNAGANGNAGAGANGAAGYGAHAAGAYGRGAHAAGRVRAHAGKHLAQTSDPTNALAAAGMLASALGFIAMGFKTKKRRAK
ncbi:LPXTG-motif cell wall anchor domain protein, partial [Fannyhessea vaginae PB189-T1-4]